MFQHNLGNLVTSPYCYTDVGYICIYLLIVCIANTRILTVKLFGYMFVLYTDETYSKNIVFL